MRILVVSSWFPAPPINGSKLRAFHALAQLASRGHRVTVLAFAEAGEDVCAADLRAFCADIEIVRGNPHKAAGSLPTRGFFDPTPRSYAATYSAAMASLIASRWRDHDVLLALQVGAALYIDARIGIPSVFDEAEVGVIRDRYRHERRPVRRVRNGLTWWKYASFTRALTRRATRTTTVSEVERQHLLEAGCDADRIDVVPNGVDSDLLGIAPSDVPRDAPLIYTGAVTYAANLDAVTYLTSDILPRLRAVQPRVRLLVTGDTGGIDIRPLTAGGDVAFTGRIPSMTPLLQQSRMCVVPLRVGGGTRLKILEALAVGTPVVSTSKGIEGLDLQPDEEVLVGDDAETFAQHVARLQHDDDLRARLSVRGRQAARRYTWTLAGDALERTLQRALDQRSRAGTKCGGSSQATRATSAVDQKGSSRGVA